MSAEPLSEQHPKDPVADPAPCPACGTTPAVFAAWRTAHAEYAGVLDAAATDRRPTAALRDRMERVTVARERRWVCGEGHLADE